MTVHVQPEEPPPFQNVLVATDFSPGAEAAAARASRLPLSDGARLRLVHVLPAHLKTKAEVRQAQLAQRRLEQAAAAVAESAAAAGRRHFQVTAELRRGRAPAELAERAGATGAELLVVGRHSRLPLQDLFVGATAERLIRSSTLPVLVVSLKVAGPYRRPLVAVDLADTSKAVVRLALRVLGPGVKSLPILHAYRVPFEGFLTPGARTTGSTELRNHYGEQAEKGLNRLERSLEELGIEWDSTIVRADPQTAILAEAIRRRTDLLTIGTHGRRGLQRAVLGSVAETVIQAASCDVLVARAPARRK